MVKIKYVGKGMLSRDIDFSPTKNNGIYDVTKEDSDYFLTTFPKAFILLEPEAKKEPLEKKPRVKRARKKSTDIVE